MTGFRTSRRVEFRDTDAAGIVHFSAFFPMMEAAEHELLRSLGLSVLPRSDDSSDRLTWPRVSARCDYLAAARFEDVLEISVGVANIGDSSVRYAIEFRCQDRPIARGELVAVCCTLADHGRLTKASIPQPIRDKLATYSVA